MLVTRPWWTPSFPQRFAWTLFVLLCLYPLLFSQCLLLEGRLFGSEMAFCCAQPMSVVGGASSDWLWETERNADVSKWAASTHEASRNWLALARLCPLFISHVLRGLSLVRQKVFPGNKVSLKAAVTLVNLYTTQGYRMVPFNLKVLAKSGLCSNCSQKLHECSPARARKIFSTARMLGFSLTFPYGKSEHPFYCNWRT